MARADTAPVEMLQTLGLQRIVAMEGGRAALEFLAGMHMCHSGGVVQGGFVSGWIDAAMAHAIIGLHRDQGNHDVAPISLELKISFFAPARPGLVRAEGWIEQGGKSTCFAEGRLLDAAGKVLAKASSTIKLLSNAKIEAGSRAALSAQGG
ncbi:PaaI family thioesterase [Novosphingobium sp. KCTC 2891]|uniref:PaaI family thioesterase n=1 Tax=Novosphingobium sp. KCTC 2891 TaxID=2989730 RepID=UPI002223291B|nr:PaaI family thioesterase [Novosphingobium sp. KCTC 2891]MCW1383397.1 PaaI family thioesterase [Novosphingobium sp. KCTC 2891]